MKSTYLSTNLTTVVTNTNNSYFWRSYVKKVLFFALLLCFCGVLQAQVNLNNGLVAYYPFNGNANDESGNGNNGIVQGATLTTDRFGNSKSAYIFDGISNYIKVSDNNLLDMTSKISITGWLRKDSNVPWASVLTKGGEFGNENNYSLHNSVNNGVIFTKDSEGNCLSTTSIPLNEWHFVSLTWDGDSAKIYIDGRADKASFTSLKGLLTPNNSSLYIGVDLPESVEFFKGSLDDIRIYNRALNESEIDSLFLETNHISDNLIHQWDFEDGTTNDNIGNANGFLRGGATIENNALKISDQGQYLELPGENIAISNYPEMTMEIWFTPKNGANSGYNTMLCYFGDIVGKYGTNSCYIQPTCIQQNKASRVVISCGNVTEPWLHETHVNDNIIVYDDGLLHQMVCTINATDISFYIDGVFIGSSILSENNKISNLSNKYAYLAKSGYSDDATWLGSIHKFNLYNKALTSNEILKLYDEAAINSKSIHSVYPKIAVLNDQYTDIDISAYPIPAESRVELANENSTIKPDSILERNNFNIKARFSWKNKLLGLYDMVLITPTNDTLRLKKCFSLQEVGTKFGEWTKVEIIGGKTKISSVQIPKCNRLFAFVKKSSRTGDANSTTTWRGELRLYKNGKLVSKSSDSPVQLWWVSHPYMVDYETEIENAEEGVYTFEIENYEPNNLAKAEILFTDQPPTLELNKWCIGEILRPFGTEWKKLTVPVNTKKLIIKTEGAGYTCQVQVLKGSIMSPKNRWLFSNKVAWSGVIEGEIQNPEPGDYFLEYMESSLIDTYDQRKEVMFYVGTEEAPNVNMKLSIESLSTYKVGQGSATIDIKGTGFTGKDIIKLVKGNKEYLAEMVYKDSKNISGLFNLTSADTGKYELQIFDSVNNTIVSSIKNVVIENQAVSNGLWVEIVTRDKIRIGWKQRMIIRYGNKGNVDYQGALLYIEAPKNAIDSIYAPYIYDYSKSKFQKRDITYFYISNIPANTQNEMEVSLLTRNNNDISLEAGFVNYSGSINADVKSSNFALKSAEAESLVRFITTDQVKPGDLVFEKFGPTPLAVHVGIVYENSNGELYINELSNNKDAFAEGMLSNAYVHNERSLAELKSSANYLGYGNFGEYSSSQISKLTQTLNENYQLHNSSTNSGEYLYGIWTPTKNSGNDNLNPESRTYGHCGSYVMDRYREVGIIKSSDEINVKNPANYPFRTLDYLKYKGRFYPSANYKDHEINEPFRIPFDFSIDNQFDEYDKFYKNFREHFSKLLVLPVYSVDPSDKYCFTGTTVTQDGKTITYIDSLQTLKYRIDFWNKENATAPVLIATVKDTLGNDLDISTFNFTEAGYKDWKIKLNGGRYFNITIDGRPSMYYYLNICGDVDSASRIATITYTTLDTLSLRMPEDPMAGYMPAITSAGDEISWVSYTIDPDKEATEETEFTNKAWIEFDNTYSWEDAPHGKPTTSQYDLSAPISNVLELPTTINADSVLVHWQGSDSGCGLISYIVYVSTNGSEFVQWQAATNAQAWFKGEFNNTYSFYSIAKDAIGNIESSKQEAEAYTKMVDQNTGINDISNSSQNLIIIFPIPASTNVSVDCKGNQAIKPLSMLIQGMEGNIIRKYSKVDFPMMIDVSGLKNGIYLVVVQTNKGMVTGKLVVCR